MLLELHGLNFVESNGEIITGRRQGEFGMIFLLCAVCTVQSVGTGLKGTVGICRLYFPGATEVNHENSLLNRSVKRYRYINRTGYTTILLVRGFRTRGPPGCITRPALIFVNHVYSTYKTTRKYRRLCIILNANFALRPTKYPAITVADLCQI